MNKYLFKILPFMMVMAYCANFSSCSKDDGESLASQTENYEANAWEQKLFNTGWLFVKADYYSTDGQKILTRTDAHLPLFFSSRKSYTDGKFDGSYLLYDGNNNEIGYWSVSEGDGVLNMLPTKKINYGNYSSFVLMYPSWSYIEILTEYEMKLKDKTGNGVYYFTRNSQNPNDEVGGGDNGDKTGEAPQIGFYDFSATQTSIKVRYEIFNRDAANISSARIYYGTSPNPTKSVSASVAGNYITATISGLSKGTEYYVKCRATGSGGSTTTDAVKCITNY